MILARVCVHFLLGSIYGWYLNSVCLKWDILSLEKGKGKGQKRRPWQKSLALKEAALRCAWCVLGVKTLYAYFRTVLAL